MINVDERDMYGALFLLHEAKGSIDALIDLGDSELGGTLLEDHKRIYDAIKILLDAIERNRKNEIMEHAYKTLMGAESE